MGEREREEQGGGGSGLSRVADRQVYSQVREKAEMGWGGDVRGRRKYRDRLDIPVRETNEQA